MSSCKRATTILPFNGTRRQIKLYPHDHVYYSNRSAAYPIKGFAESALKDAETCIGMKADWPKGTAAKEPRFTK